MSWLNVPRENLGVLTRLLWLARMDAHYYVTEITRGRLRARKGLSPASRDLLTFGLYRRIQALLGHLIRARAKTLCWISEMSPHVLSPHAAPEGAQKLNIPTYDKDV